MSTSREGFTPRPELSESSRLHNMGDADHATDEERAVRVFLFTEETLGDGLTTNSGVLEVTRTRHNQLPFTVELEGPSVESTGAVCLCSPFNVTMVYSRQDTGGPKEHIRKKGLNHNDNRVEFAMWMPSPPVILQHPIIRALIESDNSLTTKIETLRSDVSTLQATIDAIRATNNERRPRRRTSLLPVEIRRNVSRNAE
ncbi:hypothetical protein B0H16DRAFT_1469531 [Mycena metata]|uniref:Uncharacterized protein n=1 Tax=Mycena metata TaxID=1033252 RepID=A0AAD7HYY4_9AGAR|nr:hypothetical protein B0H16DRAFT_1469531 [Mycena metata]